jgi:hypothetical protein
METADMTREIEAPMANLDDRVKDLEELIARMIPAVRTAQASQGVHEFFITHLISHIADMTADRDVSLRNMVAGIEISL